MLTTDTGINDSYTPDDVMTATRNFMNVVSGNEPQSERDPGLILTSEDVRQIRRYIKAGLELPLELSQVRQSLGNYDSSVRGLEPAAIRDLYQEIHNHASSWSPIEQNIKKVGSDLNVFAGSLIEPSRLLVENIQALASYQQLQIKDLTPEQIDKLPPVELVPGDRKKLDSLGVLFDEMSACITRHGTSTGKVKEGVSVFKNVLRDEIATNVNRKANLASSREANEEVARLNAEVAQLNERIEQKAGEYSRHCRDAWIGVWWGPIGAAISGSIFGPKATRALREKNALIEQKRELEKKLDRLNRLLASLIALETNLQDMRIRVDGAISGVSSLESLWLLLSELIESSRSKLMDLDNATALIILVSRFKTIISNWTDIKKQSYDLLTAFDKALNDN